MASKRALAAAAAAALVQQLERPQSDTFENITYLDQPTDGEMAHLAEQARALVALSPVAAVICPDYPEAVGLTAHHFSLGSQGNRGARGWGPVSGAIAGVMWRLLYCLLHRPRLTRRLIGDAYCDAVLTIGKRYFTACYQGTGVPVENYLTPLVARRAWTGRDFASLPVWPQDPPSLRQLWRQNRAVVRGWSADKRALLLTELREMA